MKKRNFIYLTEIILFVLLFLISCSNDENSRELSKDQIIESTGETIDKTIVFWNDSRDYVFNEKEEFKEAVDQAKEKLDEQIVELQEETENASADLKNEYNEAIKFLKEKSDEINKEMKGFSQVTEENWSEFKEGINLTWNDVQNAWEDFYIDIHRNDY